MKRPPNFGGPIELITLVFFLRTEGTAAYEIGKKDAVEEQPVSA